MNYEKGFAETQEKVVYSGLNIDPQYVILVNPSSGSYYVDVVGNGEDECSLSILLFQGSDIVFNRTFTKHFKMGELQQTWFNVRQFGPYFDIWESEIEELHKPYLEVVPDLIRIGLYAGKNQDIPIILKTPARIPPTGVSGVIIPAENVTFSVTKLIGGGAPAATLKDIISFSENGFSIPPNSSKIIKAQLKIPEEFRNTTYIGYIFVKSSIGDDVIFVSAFYDNITTIEPLITFPIISFEDGKVIANFGKMEKGINFIDIPPEVNLSIKNLEIESKTNLTDVRIITEILTEDKLIAKNISKIDKFVYQYLEITKNNIANKDISYIKIKFQVHKKWIKEKEINLIKLFKFENNTWKSLETSKISEDINFIYYEGISPAFSVYAIGGEKTKELIPDFLNWHFYISVIVTIVIVIAVFVWKKSKVEYRV